MLPSPTELLYTPYYCEENVWQLASHPHFADVADCKVVFISNRTRQCWFWFQRNALDNRPILWDYHVVLLAEGKIWDLDTRLPFPCDARRYLDSTFTHVGRTAPEQDPLFRLISRDEFLAEFSSDRSHMLDSAGNWMQPPPQWDCIRRGQDNNLQKFIDMDDTTYGVVKNLAQVKEIC